MTQETEVLEPEELEALLAQINTRAPTGARNYALLQLMSQTGIRCGEALQVTVGDIRQETWAGQEGAVRVWVLRLPRKATKGQRPRQGIPLASATRQALDSWREKRAALGIRGGPLFCTISQGVRAHPKATGEGFRPPLPPGREMEATRLRPGRALNDRYVRELVARLAEKAGIERRVHPHMLRHTALTALYDRTQNLRLVQQVAGHASSRMTERYTHVHPLALAEAMGALEGEQGRRD